MHKACLSGAGIGRLVELSAAPYMQEGRLVAIPADWSFGAMPIHAVYPSRKNIPFKVRAFVNFVRTTMRAGNR